MAEDSIVCKAVQRYLHELARAIDPVAISTELYSKEVIDERTWEDARKDKNGPNYDRNLDLLGALLRAMRASPSNFEKFCYILKHESTTESLATKLEDEAKKLRDIQGTVLYECHVTPLVNRLAIYASKWKDIGLQLGFRISWLETIETNSPGQKARVYLRKMLTEWVQWTPDSHGKYATLKDLKEALYSYAVSLGTVAESLKIEQLQEESTTLPGSNKQDSCKVLKQECTEGTRLYELHVTPLVNQLAMFASKWKTIGLCLGFLSAELETIAMSPPGQKAQVYLREMLIEWIQWTPDSRGRYATLEDLKKTLRTSGVNLGIVAESLTFEHLQKESTTATLSGSTKQVLDSTSREADLEEPPCARKQRLTIKAGKIQNDKFLMDIAREICEKWEEVGIALSIDYKVLKSIIGGDTSKPDHTKAFHMLQEWKGRAGERFTYQVLSSALEDCGLNSCAQQYCYNACIENEQ